MTKLLGTVAPGRIVKVCQLNKCGRIARQHSAERRKMLCDRCVDPVIDLTLTPIADDGKAFAPAAAPKGDLYQDVINAIKAKQKAQKEAQ